MPVILLLLIERERSRQQPLLHDGGLAVASIKAESRGKSLMAIPVKGKAKNGVNFEGIFQWISRDSLRNKPAASSASCTRRQCTCSLVFMQF